MYVRVLYVDDDDVLDVAVWGRGRRSRTMTVYVGCGCCKGLVCVSGMRAVGLDARTGLATTLLGDGDGTLTAASSQRGVRVCLFWTLSARLWRVVVSGVCGRVRH